MYQHSPLSSNLPLEPLQLLQVVPLLHLLPPLEKPSPLKLLQQLLVARLLAPLPLPLCRAELQPLKAAHQLFSSHLLLVPFLHALLTR